MRYSGIALELTDMYRYIDGRHIEMRTGLIGNFRFSVNIYEVGALKEINDVIKEIDIYTSSDTNLHSMSKYITKRLYDLQLKNSISPRDLFLYLSTGTIVVIHQGSDFVEGYSGIDVMTIP